jgi:sugar lactone lactonase YvrE
VRAGKVFRIDLDGKVTIVADVASRPLGLGFLPDGDLLVASMTQRLILKAKDATLGQEDLGRNAIAIYRWPSVSMSALRQGKVV